MVCPHCRSAIARLDRDLKDLGKVAALVETESPLSIGLAGRYQGKSFRLTGRAQMRHAQGGVWDEWYAAFDDNRWGWLAEAQGRFYMSFEQKLEHLPPFENLTIGEAVPKLATPLVVAEKGTAVRDDGGSQPGIAASRCERIAGTRAIAAAIESI